MFETKERYWAKVTSPFYRFTHKTETIGQTKAKQFADIADVSSFKAI